MNKVRVKIEAQDRILTAIIGAAKFPPDEINEHTRAVSAAILAEGSKLAAKWGARHPQLPDTRRDAAS